MGSRILLRGSTFDQDFYFNTYITFLMPTGHFSRPFTFQLEEQQRSIPKCSIYCISLISGAQLTVQDLILHYTSYLDEGPGKSIPKYSVQKHGHSFGLRCLVQGLWQFLGEDRPSRLGPKAWPSAYSSILSQFMKIFLLHFPIHCTTRRTELMLSKLREGQNM